MDHKHNYLCGNLFNISPPYDTVYSMLVYFHSLALDRHSLNICKLSERNPSLVTDYMPLSKLFN